MSEARRDIIIAGNWKMNTDLESAPALARAVAEGLSPGLDAEVLLFPPAPFLAQVAGAVADSAHPIGVGCQNLYFEDSGAFTGEISASMVLSAGARWALVGHSERRHVLGEGDELIHRKLKAALKAGLHPMLCVGEKLDQRERGETEKVVLGQLDAGLGDLDPEGVTRVVIAYEPVWAIGTGRTATPEQGGEVHRAIRRALARRSSESAAAAHPILYGGSVNPANVKELMSEPDIDGVLVGGASLDAAKFLAICRRD